MRQPLSSKSLKCQVRSSFNLFRVQLAHSRFSGHRKSSETRAHYVGSERWTWMTIKQELLRIEEIQPISPGDLCGHPSFLPSAPNLDLCPEKQKKTPSILKVHSGEMPLNCIIVQNCREKHFFSSLSGSHQLFLITLRETSGLCSRIKYLTIYQNQTPKS